MNKLIGIFTFVALVLCVLLMLVCLSGCSTYRVETTASGARVYGRGVYEQTADGDVTIDTSSSNTLDNAKMIGIAALDAVAGTMQRMGISVGD